jgi:hypothetical protein
MSPKNTAVMAKTAGGRGTPRFPKTLTKGSSKMAINAASAKGSSTPLTAQKNPRVATTMATQTAILHP